MTRQVDEVDLWLVGSGPMARAYAAVLDDLGFDFRVIGRGQQSAEAFEAVTRHPVRTAGVRSAIKSGCAPSRAIVAVGVDQLAGVACELLDAGTKRILLEKPGAMSLKELEQVDARAGSATVMIAYNRRHYASTAAARRMVAEDGGVTSFAFEVTEWPHATEPTQVTPTIRKKWFLAQPSHVVDLAFHIGGTPVDWQCWQSGSLPWHPESARFSGAGITARGATFGFHGDWEAPGRWSLEVMTRRRRLIFRPLEKLQVTSLGSNESLEVAIDDHLDVVFKPGLHEQTRLFLDDDDSISCTLEEQMANMAIYEKMAGYQ